MIFSVIGATGLVGYWLVESLLRERAVIVRAFSRRRERVPKAWWCRENFEFIEMDVCDPKAEWDRYFEESQVVYYLAGTPGIWFSLKNPNVDAQVSILGIINVLRALCKLESGKLIFASSCQVYRDPNGAREDSPVFPLTPYAAGKLAAELYIQMYGEQFGLRWTILRPSWIYGPRMVKNPIYDMLTGFLDRTPIRLNLSLESALDFVHVFDIVEALKLAAAQEWDSEIVNIGSNRAVPLHVIYQFLCQRFGYRLDIEQGERKTLAQIDNSKALSLGWRVSMPLEEGLENTIDFFRKQRDG